MISFAWSSYIMFYLTILIISLKYSKTLHSPEFPMEKCNIHYHNHSHYDNILADKFYLRENDKLNSNEVVMLVISAGKYLRSRVIPAIRTWMRLFPTVFVLLEDSPNIRFQMRFCIQKDYDDIMTSFKCHGEPTYLLTRQCVADYFESLCCRTDVLLYFIKTYLNDVYDQMKYVTLADDDIYWRADTLLSWLYLVDQANVSHIPIIGNIYKDIRTRGVYNHKRKCKEIFSNGWFQPTVLNKAALNKYSDLSKSFATFDLCKAFNVYQDVAIGIIAWMLQLYHIYIPYSYEINNPNTLEKSGSSFIALHHIRNLKYDDCDFQYHSNSKYNQSIAIGCGDVDHNLPHHNIKTSLNMYDVYNKILNEVKENKFAGFEFNKDDWIEIANKQYYPILRFLDGYNRTKHYQNYNITEKWKVYGLNNCEYNVSEVSFHAMMKVL